MKQEPKVIVIQTLDDFLDSVWIDYPEEDELPDEILGE